MIKSRGPNVSPGVELSHDRSGNSIAPIATTLRHPFAVQSMGMKDGKVQFAIHEGNVFTGNGTGQALVQIDDTTVTVKGEPKDPTKLTNANVSTYYEASISNTEPTVLYVRVKNDLDDKAFKYELVAKSTIQVAQEYTNEKPFHYSESAIPVGLQNNFPVQIVRQVQHCDTTYTLTLNQEGRKYESVQQWIGTFQYPIGTFTVSGDNNVSFVQILRSDIFFPFNRQTKSSFVDTGVTSVVFSVQGECCCQGCGCGCCPPGCCPPPGCCGCEPPGCCPPGCCPPGCCGCGCVNPPVYPPPSPPVPPGGGSGGPGGGGGYSGLESYVVEREIPGSRAIAQLDDFFGPFPIYGPVSPKPASAFPRPNGTPATPGSPGTEYAYFVITKYRYERILGTGTDQTPASFKWNKISDIYSVNKLPYSYKGANFPGWPP